MTRVPDSARGRTPFGVVLLVLVQGCADTRAAPPPECAALWADSAATAFVDELVAATRSETPVWPGYDLGDGAYVLHAGDTEAGAACLGLWRGGRAIAYAALPDAPRLSTPLYGYHLPEPDAEDVEREAAPRPRGAQPESIRTWLLRAGVERATIMPVTVEDFPFPLPPLVKAQVAIHEGFHVEVQSPHWAGSSENWPTWDRQPARQDVQTCYAGSERVSEVFEDEREQLARTVEALLDNDSTAACEAGRTFQDRRRARYELLADVTVARHDSTPGTCREAEAIMALEEGTADYASWTRLFELGRATREQLMGHYRAQLADAFYLTGAMQLHAIARMDSSGGMAAAERIATSPTPEAGSITAVFDDALQAFCGSAGR